jgi:3-methyladenine DNA glycosylase/8-oxoguanine DNA glycosylase
MITEMILPAVQPFILRSVIHSHGWYQLAPFKEEVEGNGLSCILSLSNKHVIQLKIFETLGGVRVEVDEKLIEQELKEVAQDVAWMFDLNKNLADFYIISQSEPKLSKAMSQAQGRILRSSTLFEDVLKTILTTHTLWNATKRMNSNLIEQFGDPLPGNPSLKTFPNPETLAVTTEETLRQQTRLGYRAPSVLALARQITSGNLDLESLKYSNLPTVELRKILQSIRGIGPYASANLLMLLGRYNFLTVDSWAMKMVSREWYNGEPVTPAQVEKAFEKWGEWKGLVYWLWDFTTN